MFQALISLKLTNLFMQLLFDFLCLIFVHLHPIVFRAVNHHSICRVVGLKRCLPVNQITIKEHILVWIIGHISNKYSVRIPAVRHSITQYTNMHGPGQDHALSLFGSNHSKQYIIVRHTYQYTLFGVAHLAQ